MTGKAKGLDEEIAELTAVPGSSATGQRNAKDGRCHHREAEKCIAQSDSGAVEEALARQDEYRWAVLQFAVGDVPQAMTQGALIGDRALTILVRNGSGAAVTTAVRTGGRVLGAHGPNLHLGGAVRQLDETRTYKPGGFVKDRITAGHG